jgi:hypothetical protein
MLCASRRLTPASADVKSGGKFAIANFVTLFTVSWKHLLAPFLNAIINEILKSGIYFLIYYFNDFL